MKLFFDARFIRTDFHDGISRYSTELGNALAKKTDVTFIICEHRQKDFLPAGAAWIKTSRPTSILEPFLSFRLNKYKPDVVFSPMQTFGSVGRKFKLILTSHDMIYFRHKTPPHDFNPFIRFGWWLYHLTYIPERITLNHADLVATVSQTVKAEFGHTRLTKRPIVVVPNAPQKLAALAGPIKQTRPRNIIYMGSFMEYKNVETLIKGMRWLPGYTLHLLSRISDARRAELKALAPKGAAIVFHNGVSDTQYAQLLANNAVLATASYDEGYGLPIAEALALGVPAVISDIPIFHEVAGEGALYFDPNEPKEFAEQVKVLGSKKQRDTLVANGKKHIATFSWDTSAQTLLDAIKTHL